MIILKAPDAVRTMMVYFGRGDYIMEGLCEIFEREGIDAALITSGIGSLDICKLHTITKTETPSVDRCFTLEGPVEVGSMQGSVAGGVPHVHVVVDDVKNDKVYVAHLEPGSRVCYRAELGIIVLDGVKTQTVTDPETGLIGVEPVEE